MNDKREAEVEKMLLVLVAYFKPKDPLSDLEINLYHRGLEDLPVENIKAACLELLRSGKWFPKIAEIRELAAPKLPALEDRAQVQAGLVINAATANGLNHKPRFEDQITEELLRGRFSWRAICDMTPAECKWFVKEFVEAYRVFGQAGERQLQIEAPRARVAGLLKGIGGALLVLALWLHPASAFQYDTTGTQASTPTDFEVFNGPNPQRGWCDYGSRIVYQTRDYHSQRGPGTSCFFPSGNHYLPDVRPPALQSIFRDPQWGQAWEGYRGDNEANGHPGGRP